jgi:urease accessory protein
MRAGRPFVFTALRKGEGLEDVVSLIKRIGGL